MEAKESQHAHPARPKIVQDRRVAEGIALGYPRAPTKVGHTLRTRRPMSTTVQWGIEVKSDQQRPPCAEVRDGRKACMSRFVGRAGLLVGSKSIFSKRGGTSLGHKQGEVL